MSNFLSDARTALLTELKNDTDIASRVKTWYEFGPGLQRRFTIDPAACPLLALSPADGSVARTSNVLTDVVQRLIIEVATDGQDAAPAEELVSLVIERLKACDADCLDMTADGLIGVDVERVAWRRSPKDAAPRLIWVAALTVVLIWKRA